MNHFLTEMSVKNFVIFIFFLSTSFQLEDQITERSTTILLYS